MRLLQISLYVGVMALMAAALPSEPECVEGTTSKQDCNNCVCRNGRMSCTRMACIGPHLMAPSRVQPPASEAECVEGTTSKQDCNTCVCRNGRMSCTKMACIGPHLMAPSRVQPPGSEPECVEGTTSKQDCNTCVCRNGRMTCTKMACLGLLGNNAPPASEPECVDGTSFKQDCNHCVCVNGVKACTAMACIPEWYQQRSGAIPSGLDCSPGSRWLDGCNWCTCGPNGIIGCTKKLCRPNYEPDPDKPTCDEGSSWKTDECNRCRCINGKQACSKRLCNVAETSQVVPVVQRQKEEAECEGEGRWRKECNWCRCGNGKGLCSRRGCSPAFMERLADEPECEGVIAFKKDCNNCNCVNGRAICTTKHCGPVQSPSNIGVSVMQTNLRLKGPGDEGMCTNGSRWRVDCNWCFCNEAGLALCTLKGCRPDVPDEDYNEPECVGTSRWKKDCNWCNCVEGRGLCTLKACLRRPIPRASLVRDQEGDCVQGSRWKNICNWCHCTENNIGICTKVGCHPGYSPPADEPQCTDGSRWKKDCNWCNCANGRQICTEMACNVNPISPSTCEDGQTWQQDCNTCTCRRGVAICTLKACTPIALPNRDDKHSCREGARWSEDCNQCRCSNGFRLCTKRFCAQPSLPDHCRLPGIRPDATLCEGFERKWTYDSASSKCKEIVYGGCGGTENLFTSEAECLSSCVSPVQGPHTAVSILSSQQPNIRTASTAKQDRCLLSMDPGPCFGALQRFFYNKEIGSCESFLYGGCAGNANKFETAEECQQACGGVTPDNGKECDKSQCPWMRWGHYEAKGCLPQYDDGSCCPTSFLCSSNDERLPQDKCIYKNKAYDIHAAVDVDDECSAGCRCTEPSSPFRSAKIQCASIECPDLFRPVQPGCRPLYRLGECCPFDHECVDPQSPPELESRAPSCFWNNKTYHEGDQMYFDDHPCQKCICSSNFVDPFGPGCSKFGCGLNFRYTTRYEQGCVPIYFEERCCPIDWLCPDDSRIVPEALTQAATDQAEDHRPDQCHLGSISFEVGKSLQLSNCRIDCRCVTPPEFTCVQHRSCEAITENKAVQDCPEIKCAAECNQVIDPLTGCLSCSCQNESFTCPDPECPPLCETTINYQTGCPKCKCQCPVDPHGQPPCPADCTVRTVVDDVTGCQICECDPNDPGHPFGPMLRDNCPEDHQLCPVDCVAHMVMDEATGCTRCECDPNQSGNPFEPQPISQDCPQYPDGQPPCPMDCGIIKTIDAKTGCEVCKCDPNDPGNPFMPFGPPPIAPPRNTNCHTDPDGRAPCPMDCAIIREIDETGCEICKCDPVNPGNPFVQ